MHDIILLSKISQGLAQCCKVNKIKKVSRLVVVVNEKSHVNSSNLYDYLRSYNEDLTEPSTKVEVETDDMPDQTAIIKSIEGINAEK